MCVCVECDVNVYNVLCVCECAVCGGIVVWNVHWIHRTFVSGTYVSVCEVWCLGCAGGGHVTASLLRFVMGSLSL